MKSLLLFSQPYKNSYDHYLHITDEEIQAMMLSTGITATDLVLTLEFESGTFGSETACFSPEFYYTNKFVFKIGRLYSWLMNVV